MFPNWLYYSFKPFLPWSLRMGVRRWFAVRKRQRSAAVWPVEPGSERPPASWPGWPEGRQFAFVLSHDVESHAGLANVRAMAELEMSMGVRSAFNFVPDGGYEIPEELRHWLTGNGFEVGVHDLNHDGRLFWTQAGFQRRAARINAYLKEWGAGGFRSAFMLHNLDWFHDLNVEYDASTFDTDPFEPQPDGQGTIFPFWVPAPSERAVNGRHSGYVELPYTLPQDSTLFLLLGEQTPEVWIRKLDWVAQHGGMALVNVHPDNIQFNGVPCSDRTYPVEHYVQLLKHVQTRYPRLDWQALPKEVARFVRESVQESSGGSGKQPNHKQAAVKPTTNHARRSLPGCKTEHIAGRIGNPTTTTPVAKD
jgi:hypothetical protein